MNEQEQQQFLKQQAALEQQLRQDAASLVLGRLLGSLISDIQNQAGEIAVLQHRLKQQFPIDK